MSNSPANSGWGIANGKTLLPLFAIRHSLLAHFLVPATHGARGLNLPFIHPEGWRSEDGARVQRHPQRAVTRHARRLRGALSSPSGGTRASRRSTVAIFGRGPCFHLRHFLRIRAASSSRPGRSAWRTGSRTSRGFGYEPSPRDATPRSANGTVSGDAPR